MSGARAGGRLYTRAELEAMRALQVIEVAKGFGIQGMDSKAQFIDAIICTQQEAGGYGAVPAASAPPRESLGDHHSHGGDSGGSSQRELLTPPRGDLSASAQQLYRAPGRKGGKGGKGAPTKGKNGNQKGKNGPWKGAAGNAEWTCPGCRFSNYLTRQQCYQCGEPKPGAPRRRDSPPPIPTEGEVAAWLRGSSADAQDIAPYASTLQAGGYIRWVHITDADEKDLRDAGLPRPQARQLLRVAQQMTAKEPPQPAANRPAPPRPAQPGPAQPRPAQPRPAPPRPAPQDKPRDDALEQLLKEARVQPQWRDAVRKAVGNDRAMVRNLKPEHLTTEGVGGAVAEGIVDSLHDIVLRKTVTADGAAMSYGKLDVTLKARDGVYQLREQICSKWGIPPAQLKLTTTGGADLADDDVRDGATVLCRRSVDRPAAPEAAQAAMWQRAPPPVRPVRFEFRDPESLLEPQPQPQPRKKEQWELEQESEGVAGVMPDLRGAQWQWELDTGFAPDAKLISDRGMQADAAGKYWGDYSDEAGANREIEAAFRAGGQAQGQITVHIRRWAGDDRQPYKIDFSTLRQTGPQGKVRQMQRIVRDIPADQGKWHFEAVPRGPLPARGRFDETDTTLKWVPMPAEANVELDKAYRLYLAGTGAGQVKIWVSACHYNFIIDESCTVDGRSCMVQENISHAPHTRRRIYRQ